MKTVGQENSFVSKEERALATGAIPGLFARFAIPSVFGLLFLGVQSIIDGIILGHYVGANALACVNLVLPCYSFMAAAGIVMGIGCQTLVSISMGRGNRTEANNAFRTAFVFLLSFALFISVFIWTFAGDIAVFLGANDVLRDGAVSYIHALVPFFPSMCMMFLGDYMLKSIGRPLFAMGVMTFMVLINIFLDLLFIVHFEWGITGAGIATGAAFTIGAVCNMWLLARQKRVLSLRQGKFVPSLVGQMLYNGSSEGFSELSAGITVFLFNHTMMNYLGETGVAAFSATNYVLFIGTTIFLGIADGVIPIMSYNFGAGQIDRLKATLRLAVKANLLIGVILFAGMSFAGTEIISLFFKEKNSEVFQIAVFGTSIYALAFLMNGLNILASGYFTSMGNAKVSVIISLLRSLVFVVAGILIYPAWFGITGIWFSMPMAELFTLLVSFLLVRNSFGQLQPARVTV